MTLLETLLTYFEEVVPLDFEFNGGDRNPRSDGNRPNVVCLVAHELRSGRRFRLWHDQLGKYPPYRNDRKTLFVAFYASAELGCHLSKGWDLPVNILDLFIEFRRLTNHSGERQPSASLLAALDYFKLDSIEAQAKEHWRDIVLRGGPWTEEEKVGIFDYCESDVEALRKLLGVMPITNFGHSLFMAVTCALTLGCGIGEFHSTRHSVQTSPRIGSPCSENSLTI